MFPFKQVKAGNNLLREFRHNADTEELVWHRDYHDRLVKVLSGEGWQLQMENSLPVMLKKGVVYRISAREYHRLIKGEGNLYLLIREFPNAI